MEVPAVAYIAPGTKNRHPVREVFARVKAILDLFVLRTEPRFVGEPERLPGDEPDEELLAAGRPAPR